MIPTFLYASGSNSHGQLASGTLEDLYSFGPCLFSGVSIPGALPLDTNRIQNIASGANHTLVILERIDDAGQTRAELWGCGDGARGQLGPSYRNNCNTVFKPIELPLREYGYQGYIPRLVAAAWETTYIAYSCPDKDDILISMGADDFGDLGIGGTRNSKQANTPLHIIKFDHLTPLGITNLAVKLLAAGPHHAIVHLNATLTDGSTCNFGVGWGASRHGQLGKAMTTSTGQTAAFQTIPQDIPIFPLTWDTVVASGLGNQHTVFLHNTGHLSCLGSDRKGQLQGVGSVKDVIALSCTWHGTYLVSEAGRVIAAGSHSRGQLGRDLTSTDGGIPAPVQFPFTSATPQLLGIACGSEHVLALFSVTSDSRDARTEVWGWGWNEHGNLGLGTTGDIVIPTKIWPASAASETRGERLGAVGIWAGCGTSWIMIKS
jgi:protein ATS1